jgi:hypothetical protein
MPLNTTFLRRSQRFLVGLHTGILI